MNIFTVEPALNSLLVSGKWERNTYMTRMDGKEISGYSGNERNKLPVTTRENSIYRHLILLNSPGTE